MWRKLFNGIDSLLNGTTMYRVVLYYLLGLLLIAVVFSAVRVLPYSPFGLLFSALFITGVSWVANFVFAKVFRAQTNVESVYITALILTLIITPFSGPSAASYFSIAVWASVWAMASKYIFAIKKKHIFNPAAFGVALTALTVNQAASWWVGTVSLLPFVVAGGILMTRKLLRSDLVFSFLATALVAALFLGIAAGQDAGRLVSQALFDSPLFFFAFVMLTEPLTTPPTENLRMAYGILVGFLFAPQVHLGSFYFSPELALIAGNIFSYLVSSKKKLILTLAERKKIGAGLYDFVFKPDEKLNFKPGQYLEWTLSHPHPDSRGNRRYFTIASSPTERDVRMGVRFNPNSSSFKKALGAMKKGDVIVASQLSGDFTLPRDGSKKLVLVAGGIGITPIRSMIRYLVDMNERRPITLLYSAKTADDLAYRDVFDEAERSLGMKVVYTLTGEAPAGWQGERGRIDGEMIRRHIPDYQERLFYISGTHAMVGHVKKVLHDMGVEKKNVKTDFFPGFA